MKWLNTIWVTLTQRGPIVWVRNLHYIVMNYRHDLQLIVGGVDECRKHVDITQRYVKRATKIHVDVPGDMLENSTTVVVLGEYRGKDHMQIFNLRPGSMDMLINQLKEMQQLAEIKIIKAEIEVDATAKRSVILS